MKNKKYLILLFLSLLSIDMISKYLTFLYIPKMNIFHPFYPYGGIGIFKIYKVSLSLNYVANKGIAWGFFSNYSDYIVFIRIFVVVGVVFYSIYSKILYKIPIILILTGAVGNVLDYFLYGHVIDMIHFKFGSFSYPLFNFADILITLGIVGIIFTKKEKNENRDYICRK
ncbi:MAG: hypothetical protein AMS24_02295 [Chlamydiae bacterium SM23_39]|nr:MAG: hypothetical protein AMS24_02295 [Chlamydiae bacterium SM23_39]